jgi:hypothetical protein
MLASMMLGGEQSETLDAPEVGLADGLGFGEVANGGIASRLQHVAPTMGADASLDDGDCGRATELGIRAWRQAVLLLVCDRPVSAA